MVKLLQFQSKVSHPTQMRVDREDNCHDFGISTSFITYLLDPLLSMLLVASTFSAAGVDLVPVTFQGSHKLHSLNPAYWTPTDHTHTLYLSVFNLYSGFLGASHEALPS